MLRFVIWTSGMQTETVNSEYVHLFLLDWQQFKIDLVLDNINLASLEWIPHLVLTATTLSPVQKTRSL